MYLKDIHLQQIFVIKDICCSLKENLKITKTYGNEKTNDKNKFCYRLREDIPEIKFKIGGILK